MVLIVTRVVRLAVGPVRPVGATTRVYGATTQDGIVGVMLFGVRRHGLAAQFGTDQRTAHGRQLATAAFTEFSTH